MNIKRVISLDWFTEKRFIVLSGIIGLSTIIVITFGREIDNLIWQQLGCNNTSKYIGICRSGALGVIIDYGILFIQAFLFTFYSRYKKNKFYIEKKK